MGQAYSNRSHNPEDNPSRPTKKNQRFNTDTSKSNRFNSKTATATEVSSNNPSADTSTLTGSRACASTQNPSQMTAPPHNHCAPMHVGHSNAASSSSQSQPQHASQISTLIDFARSKFEQNPTEALGALMEAMKLNSGQEAVNRAMEMLKHELGDEITDHISSRHLRMQRAVRLVEELMSDESTFLHQRGQQDLLRQAMQDGSSVVCSRCNDIISSNRWQQHQKYWCTANASDGEEGNDTNSVNNQPPSREDIDGMES